MMSNFAIIPAHNESRVIGNCLRAMAHGAGAGELEIWVVCNGCSDDTVSAVRASGVNVQVIETPVPSKRNALNMGDRAAKGFPRFYVDADVLLPLESIRCVAAVLQSRGGGGAERNGGRVLAAAPKAHFDVSKSSWAVKAFYCVWSELPYFQSGMIGSGVYAVSEEGRKRFGEFPEIIADDAFVRLHFAPHERKVVEECEFVVTAPRTLWGLIKIKTRSHLGNVELRRKYSHLMKNEEVRHGAGLTRLMRDPRRWLDIGVYVLVKCVTRWRVWRQVRQGRFSHWERDETSRQNAPVPAVSVSGVSATGLGSSGKSGG